MRIAYVMLGLCLAGCAANPPTTPGSRSSTWAHYRVQVASARDSGALTPLQAEDKLEMKYRELYGQDSTMAGAFAYRRELYAQTEAGNLPAAEAKALAKARLDEALVQQRADAAAAQQDRGIPDLATQVPDPAEPE